MKADMKRFLRKALFCAGAAVLILSGCKEKKTSNYNAQEDEFDYLITVGFAQSGEESDWRTANTESVKSTLIEENGYELIYEDTQEDQEKQIEALRGFVEQGVDYIVLNPVVETGWESVLKEIKEANIPVIVINNPIEEADNSLYECWLGSDFTEEGKTAANWLSDYLKEQEQPDAEVNIATIQGPIGTMAQTERTEGFMKVAQEHMDWVMLAQQTGEFSKETGKEVMKLFLETHPTIDVVIAENDEMAFGAIEAIKEAGRTCGPKGDMIVISYGAGKKELEAMQAGELNAAVEYNPLYGPKIAEIIQKLDSGVSLDKKQYVNEAYFDATMELDEVLAVRTY